MVMPAYWPTENASVQTGKNGGASRGVCASQCSADSKMGARVVWIAAGQRNQCAQMIMCRPQARHAPNDRPLQRR